MSPYTVALFFHLLGVILWVGGSIFIAGALIPALRNHPDYLNILDETGRRFRWMVYPALLVVILTGLYMAWERGLFVPDMWGTSTAVVFFHKLGLVFLSLVLSVLHDFVVGPQAVKTGNPRYRRTATWIARGNFLIMLGIIGLGILL